MDTQTTAIVELPSTASQEAQSDPINLGAYLALPMLLILLSVVVGPVKSLAKHIQSKMKDV